MIKSSNRHSGVFHFKFSAILNTKKKKKENIEQASKIRKNIQADTVTELKCLLKMTLFAVILCLNLKLPYSVLIP